MPQHDAIEDHDLGLAHDLKVIAAMTDRRRALRLFAGVGTAALLTGCGSDSSANGTVTAAATPTPTPSPTPTPTATATTTPATGACLVDPTETAGPYPADGTNTSNGSTSNVLTSSGVVRSDIRSSFLNGSTTTASGVALKLTLTVVNVNAACAPLAGYLVYLWHCDAQGRYSLYDVPGESWLRGALVTSQLAMPTAACSAIYSGSALYSSSVANYSRVSTANDNVFGDNTAAQIAQQTPTLTGSVAEGYVGTAIIGLAR
ncbi:intradiol ring-cleavage dioxygenase [Sphingomonas sp. Leaf10]|uniref:intradiol ring-cleavage dioxygenase n=1 Tax=Sphingomonas sp. Leaf10 TaxID=1735676 RepID=UPI0006F46F64|nr:intradiol ring-cleavage dioxygenase [Sphingomonas sp. Leaf10]KQM31779.1 intradiol ring-cleavage dioxygenase [Sphingomonas sp. Leaf10]